MKTLCFVSPETDPSYNLALEDWCLRNLNTEQHQYLLLYVNQPSVIVGRNQNIYQEINLPYCWQNNIAMHRRVSGGGTVFHDMGNLNWTFITHFDGAKVNQYEYFAYSIIQVLKELGVSAYLTPRNAIEVDGFKVSGQAQFTNRKNILSHGTLLVNSNLSYMQPSIESSYDYQIVSKAAPSVRSKTENLSNLLGKQIAVTSVIDLIQQELQSTPWQPFDGDEKALVKTKDLYRSPAWIFGKSPKCTISGNYLINRVKENLSLSIVKGKVEKVVNEKGDTMQYHPFLFQSYEDLLRAYSL